MFGYVVCDKEELKVRQFNTYKAHYCGVCHALKKRYGIVNCAMLTYDAAALSVAAGACLDDTKDVNYSIKRCVANPFRKVMVATSACCDFAADANVFLSIGKIEDNYKDERKIYAGALAFCLKGVKRKAEKHLGEASVSASKYLDELFSLEEQNCGDIDLTSNAFGQALSQIFEAAPVSDTNKIILKNIGFNLGRWIYIIDAIDDLQKDERTGSYNVFLIKYETAYKAYQHSDVLNYNAMQSIAQAGTAADLLDQNDLVDILINIIDGGATQKTHSVLFKEEV